MVTDSQRTLLAQDLPRDVVKTREHAGQKLSYVDGWYAVTRANEVFGPDGWSYATRDLREVYRGTRPGRDGENNVIVYEAVVTVTALGITREDVGIGQCDASLKALAQGIEKARKEAVTDGLKRALRTFGPSFGLALYDKDQRDVGISRAAMDLRASLESAADPDAWVKEHGDEVRSLDDDERDELRALVKRRREELKAAKPAALPELASLGIEQSDPRTAPTQPAPPDAGDVLGDIEVQVCRCGTVGALADLWIAAREDVAKLSSGAKARAWKLVGQRAEALGTTAAEVRAEVQRRDTPPHNDGPGGGRGAAPSAPEHTTARGEGHDGGAAQGAQASADAWRETAEGITAHVARVGAARHLESSARQHLRAVPEELRLHALHTYAGRLQRLSSDGTSSLAWDECVARAETWLREGPRVAVLPERVRLAGRGAVAAGGAR